MLGPCQTHRDITGLSVTAFIVEADRRRDLSFERR